MSEDSEGALGFFNAQRENFSNTCDRLGRGPALADALAAQACDNYQQNADIQAECQPAPACARGCDPCCCMQVAATAPEIFHAAHFIRLTSPAFARHGVDLAKRLNDVKARIGGLSQQERFASAQACPMVIGGACAIYSARTLACRGHISFDRDACLAAARGCDVVVTLSAAHKAVRVLVQGALQAALRDAGLAWGAYEFLGALDCALKNPDCEALWRQGEDVFADLRLDDPDTDDMLPSLDAARAM